MLNVESLLDAVGCASFARRITSLLFELVDSVFAQSFGLTAKTRILAERENLGTGGRKRPTPGTGSRAFRLVCKKRSAYIVKRNAILIVYLVIDRRFYIITISEKEEKWRS